MGATVDGFKATHREAVSLLGEIDSSGGQQRIDALNSLKEALLAHVGEENSVIQEAMDKSDVEGPFKSSAQRFMDELGSIAQTALLPFFDKFSSPETVDSEDFADDFNGIKSALADRIAFEEGKFYPELEKLGY
ncbi:dihydrodipicolinate synthase/N-acetylneuraminate lyase [Candidatus Scalindua japonica]|uniref:Dihydrodipicolinate synthase/N-acetylneuraminate lyase n=1 Tax=Candidatus Scalindua japonica TaxID=1284222 RepID=A0A286TYE9_9BACT|nr:hemerythrin domain-containing protein [Candidatus Scalindua japonica]GAX60900.1 dihydrodipicolinate synthase/N-acetylneuraminate lyase [Candidatus Scalindua japonica]